MDNLMDKEAWELSRNMLEADKLEPSDELEEMINKGLSDAEIIEHLQKKYSVAERTQ